MNQYTIDDALGFSKEIRKHPVLILFNFFFIFYFYHKIKVIPKKQGDHTKANKSGEEAQKETMGLIDIGLPQSKK